MNQVSSQWDKIYFLTGIEVTRPGILGWFAGQFYLVGPEAFQVNERFSYAKDSRPSQFMALLVSQKFFSCYGG